MASIAARAPSSPTVTTNLTNQSLVPKCHTVRLLHAHGVLRTGRRAGLASRSVVTAALDTEDRGASGLDVNGNRPTSKRAWEIIASTLREKNVRLIPAQEVQFAKDRGVTIVDIRPENEYSESHIPGAVNVPLYQLISGWSPRQIVRRAGFAFFGVLNGTEKNPAFEAVVEETLPDKNAPVVLYCSMGGQLDPSETKAAGMQSRSLTGAYELIRSGFKNVSVLSGGFGEWRRNGRPVTGDDEEEE